MTVKELILGLDLKPIAGERGTDNRTKGVYICDLLSWVMSHAQMGNIWITVQTNINIVAVAHLTEVACIIIPEDINVDAQAIDRANKEGIPILSYHLNSYELACRISAL